MGGHGNIITWAGSDAERHGAEASTTRSNRTNASNFNIISHFGDADGTPTSETHGRRTYADPTRAKPFGTDADLGSADGQILPADMIVANRRKNLPGGNRW